MIPFDNVKIAHGRFCGPLGLGILACLVGDLHSPLVGPSGRGETYG